MVGFGAFLTYHIFFSLPQEEEKMKQMLNTLNISDFISKIVQFDVLKLNPIITVCW